MSGEHTAFFYGTLMAPEVFFSVCYGDKNPPQAIRDMYTFTPAILKGYCRHRVRDADYPAIVAEEGHKVLGIYATGLTSANMYKLDNFEGSEYYKEDVEVKLVTKDGNATVEGEAKKTSAYVFHDREYLELGEWDFEEFRKEKMQLWTRGGWAFSDDPNVEADGDKAAW